MFERYTEESRIVFFARYEAAQMCSPYIEPEHLLLGLIREAVAVAIRYIGSPQVLKAIREEIEARAQGKSKISTSVDLPVSRESQEALAYGAEESEAMQQTSIRPEHLLLGLLRQEDSRAAKMLNAHGVVYDSVRRQVLGVTKDEPAAPVAPSLESAVARLRQLLSGAELRLMRIDEVKSSTPAREGGWCPKQILGHLIDSASNNHQRFVRALTQNELVWPNYEQEAWVKTQRYNFEAWDSLVKLWVAYNRHLLWIVLHIPQEKSATTCRIGDREPIKLEELISSYVDHMEHHLKQIPGMAGGGALGGLL